METDTRLRELHTELGFKRLNPTWAKAEILLGLSVATAGFLIGTYGTLSAAGLNWSLAVGGVLLAVLGGYLAMAGHRSHLYQSNNLLAAWIASRQECNGDAETKT